MQLTVTTTYDIPPADICDFLTTVIEGGSVDWCDSIILISAQDASGKSIEPTGLWYTNESLFSPGATIQLRVDFEESAKSVFISEQNLLEGFQLLARDLPLTFHNLASGDYDALDTDNWFQLSCFKEIVYG